MTEDAGEDRRALPEVAAEASRERSVPAEPSDSDLLLEALGDPRGLASDAFARFLDRKRGVVRSIFLAVVKGTAAQDLGDFESWFWLLRLWQGKRGGGSRVEDLARARSVDAYLRASAHNAALDWWRGAAVVARRRGRSLDAWEVEDPRVDRPAVLDEELAGAVLRALRHAIPALAPRICVLAALCLDALDAERVTALLDAEERAFLQARGAAGLLTRGEAGLSRRAVGEALGLTHDAARQVVSRGMRALRAHVRDCAACRLDWLLPE